MYMECKKKTLAMSMSGGVDKSSLYVKNDVEQMCLDLDKYRDLEGGEVEECGNRNIIYSCFLGTPSCIHNAWTAW